MPWGWTMAQVHGGRGATTAMEKICHGKKNKNKKKKNKTKTVA